MSAVPYSVHDLMAARDACPSTAAGPRGQYPSQVRDAQCHALAERLITRRYHPSRAWVHRLRRGSRERLVVIPTGVDRVLVQAWRDRHAPRIDRSLHPFVWGFRRGRSCAQAVASLRWPLTGDWWLVQTDIAKLFDSLRRASVSRGLSVLLGAAHTPFDDQLIRAWCARWCPGTIGIPTGLAASPDWSNAALHVGVDAFVRDALADETVHSAVRYADDLTLVTTRPPAGLLRRLRPVLRADGLTLHEGKTKVTSHRGLWPVRVLGYTIRPVNGGRFEASGCATPTWPQKPAFARRGWMRFGEVPDCWR